MIALSNWIKWLLCWLKDLLKYLLLNCSRWLYFCRGQICIFRSEVGAWGSLEEKLCPGRIVFGTVARFGGLCHFGALGHYFFCYSRQRKSEWKKNIVQFQRRWTWDLDYEANCTQVLKATSQQRRGSDISHLRAPSPTVVVGGLLWLLCLVLYSPCVSVPELSGPCHVFCETTSPMQKQLEGDEGSLPCSCAK